MKCNCNNKGDKMSADIKVVQGNMLRLAIPLTLRTVEKVGEEIEFTDTDFIPSPSYPVNVVFAKGISKFAIEAVMHDGNVAYVEDNGTLPVGIYSITVTCNDNAGHPYRFKQNTVVQIVDTTIEAGITTPVEFEVETWYLNAAIYLALKGEDGVGIEDIITETSEEIGGVNTVTFVLTNGETRSFTVLNGSGSVDNEFDSGSRHPVANSTLTERFNALDESLQELFGDVDYDSNSKSIRFYNKSKTNVIATLDARPFIKDGMVNTVYISNNTLVITFNTDAGREAIGVPLSSVFNPNNYYTKTQVDNRLSDITTMLYNDYVAKANLLGRDNNVSTEYMPHLVLYSMGEPYDEGDDSVVPASCPYFNNGYISIQSGGMQALTIGQPSTKVVYCNAKTNKLYRWNGTDFDLVGGDEKVVFGAFLGEGKFVVKSFDLSTHSWVNVKWAALDVYSIYVDVTANKTYRYDGELDFVLIGGSDNEGTVTGVRINGTTHEPTDGVVDLGTVITQHQDISGKANTADLATVATSGSYNDLTNKPTIPAEQVNADWDASSGKAQILHKPNLATVATSGSYNDLTDKPTIPEGADLTGYATEQYVDTAIAGLVDSSPQTLDTLNELAAALGDDPNFATTMATQLGNKVDKVSGKGLSTNDYTTSEKTKLSELPTAEQLESAFDSLSDTIPSRTSDLINDSGFVTSSTMNSALDGKQDELTFDTTPTANSDNPVTSGGVKTYVDSKPTITGVTTNQDGTFTISLSNGNSYTIDLNHTHSQYAEAADLADVATSGSYNDLTNKPTIPAAYDDTTLSGRVTALENAGFITTETDPTVPAWAKQSTKPTYTAQEVGALPASTTIPSKTSDLTNDSGFINRAMYYGLCESAASAMPKVCTVETFPTTTTNGVTHAADGTIIAVKFTNSDTNTTAAPELNVNGIGAKAIMYNNAIVTSTAKNTTVAGTAKQIAFYRYDPEMDDGNGAWEYLAKSVDSNSTYSQASLGQGYGTQTNSAAATAITSTISSFTLSTGGIVAIKFVYDVPANATLNISSKGAKAIYNKGAAIAAGVIKAGDTATFIYSTYYHLISIDRSDSVTVDSTITQNGTNPVQGGAIYNALEGKVKCISYDDESELLSDTSQPHGTIGYDYENGNFYIYDSDGGWVRVCLYADLIDRITGLVPTTRTVNGKALSSNITLNASDVGAMAEATVVEVATAGAVSQALAPNTFYKFTGALTSLTLTLTAGTGLVVYAGKFTTGSGWGSNGLSIPATVTEATGNDEIAASKTYEFSILDNVIVIKEV